MTGPERSGLYYVHAKGEWSGAFFSFPWVVAPARPQAPIAVLASNNTWNAYNNFGGRSNYINADRLPERPIVNARLDLPRYTESGAFNVWAAPDAAYAPLSFERPEMGNHVPEEMQVTDPIRGRLACGMAPAEWRLLGVAGARGVSLRPLCGDAARRRAARPGRLPGARPQRASGVLDTAHVRRA